MGDALALLRGSLDALEQLQARCEDLFSRPSSLVDDVVGPQLTALFEASIARLGASPREDVLTSLDDLLMSVARANVLKHIPTARLLRTAMTSLVAQEQTQQLAAAEHAAWDGEFSLQQYRALRRQVPKVPLSYLAAQVCLRLDPSLSEQLDELKVFEDIARQLSALPPELIARVEQFDWRRLERPLGFLEAWWRSMSSLEKPRERLGAMGRSRLLDALREEVALERFRLEAELHLKLFPQAACMESIVRRVRALQAELASIQRDESQVLAEDWAQIDHP